MTHNKLQIHFWANSIFYLSLFEGLRSYLIDISMFLDKESGRLKDNDPNEYKNEKSEAEYAIAIDRYESLFPVLLGNSFVIVLVSSLERELMLYLETIAKVSKLDINKSEFKRGFYVQFKTYLSKNANIPFDFNINKWNDIIGLIEVRNAIIHNSGIIEDDRNGRCIKEFRKRCATLSIQGNVIHPTIPFCNLMVQLIHDFLVSLTNAAYQHYK